MLESFLLFLGSMAGIIILARFALYEPAQRLARTAGLSRSATGQMLGYLTSAPELVATIFVATTGLFAVVSTNILGSNVINVMLAAVAALWFRQMRRLTGSHFRWEIIVVIGSIVIPILLLATGQDSAWWTAIVFALGYVAYLRFMRGREEPGGPVAAEDAAGPATGVKTRTAFQIGVLILGLAGLYLLGESVRELGTAFAVPAVVLGVLTAVATSLPELTTFFASFAAHRRAGTDGTSEVMHNLMASNVVNLLIVQSVGIVVFQLAS